MGTKKAILIKRIIDGEPAPKTGRAFLADTKVPGLLVQITATGTRSFQVYKKAGGKPVRVTLGRYPDMTIEQARKAAMDALSKLAGGINPTDQKRRAKLEAKTLREVFEDYKKARKDLKPSTADDMEKAFRQVCPDWMEKPLNKITPALVEKRHSEHGQKRSAARSNLAMRYLRAIFNFARAQYKDQDEKPLIGENPVKRLSEARAWYRVERRKTVIKSHELGAWVNAVLSLPGEAMRDYHMVVLMTGLRRQEALDLKWSEVDFKGRTITVLDPKNHNDHTLPLSDYLFELLSRRKDGATSDTCSQIQRAGASPISAMPMPQ